eukprot:1745480-Prymnesium_polylepis.2
MPLSELVMRAVENLCKGKPAGFRVTRSEIKAKVHLPEWQLLLQALVSAKKIVYVALNDTLGMLSPPPSCCGAPLSSSHAHP